MAGHVVATRLARGIGNQRLEIGSSGMVQTLLHPAAPRRGGQLPWRSQAVPFRNFARLEHVKCIGAPSWEHDPRIGYPQARSTHAPLLKLDRSSADTGLMPARRLGGEASTSSRGRAVGVPEQNRPGAELAALV